MAIPATSPRLLRRLWERMAVIFGPRWTSTNGDSPQAPNGRLTLAGETWAGALAGVTPLELGRGLQECVARGLEWPPTCGGFRGMALGIPTFDRVHYEVMHPDERSAFTLLVWKHLDTHRYRQAGERAAERMLREAYEVAREKRMTGTPLPALPVAALTEEKPEPPPPVPPEVYRERIAELKALIQAPAVPAEDATE